MCCFAMLAMSQTKSTATKAKTESANTYGSAMLQE